VIVHTQLKLLNLRQKKNHIFEVQINGGKIEDKIKFGYGLFEKEVKLDSVFNPNELIDVIGVTKGKGVQGVIQRFGVKHLQKKSHRGFRKVGCVGAWHPARIHFTVARTGQQGYHHRTEINKKIYRIANGASNTSATTQSDQTEKSITPLGGFPHYGVVKNDFIMVKGCVIGPKKKILLLRKSLLTQTNRVATEEVSLKFIDTSSKLGHGRFQTYQEKAKFYGRDNRQQSAPKDKATAKN